MATQKTLPQWQWMLRIMGLFYIPLLGYVRPKLEYIDEHEARVSIRLRRRTRNHLKSMYFGALAVGADVTAGLHAFYFADELGVKPSFVFKSMQATFHKRAMSTVNFSTADGQRVRETVDLAMTSGERQHAMIQVEAKTADGELVASFEMQISLKFKR